MSLYRKKIDNGTFKFDKPLFIAWVVIQVGIMLWLRREEVRTIFNITDLSVLAMSLFVYFMTVDTLFEYCIHRWPMHKVENYFRDRHQGDHHGLTPPKHFAFHEIRQLASAHFPFCMLSIFWLILWFVLAPIQGVLNHYHPQLALHTHCVLFGWLAIALGYTCYEYPHYLWHLDEAWWIAKFTTSVASERWKTLYARHLVHHKRYDINLGLMGCLFLLIEIFLWEKMGLNLRLNLDCLWDRIFGTFVDAKVEVVTIDEPDSERHGSLQISLLPFKLPNPSMFIVWLDLQMVKLNKPIKKIWSLIPGSKMA